MPALELHHSTKGNLAILLRICPMADCYFRSEHCISSVLNMYVYVKNALYSCFSYLAS